MSGCNSTSIGDGKNKIRRKDNILWKQNENECVLLKLDDGDYFSLEGIGLFVWKLLDGQRDFSEIASSIALNYNISSEQTCVDLEEFIGDLLRLNFIEVLA